MGRPVLFTALVAALLAPRAVLADSVTLVASQDETLYEGSGDLANAAGAHLFAGANAGGGKMRSLLAFDLAAAFPPGTPIQSATLRLYADRTTSLAQSLSLSRVLAKWGEGTSAPPGNEGSGTAATAGDATWLFEHYPDASWSTAGGDFSPAPSATTSVDAIGTTYSWSSSALTADVRAWTDAPSSNFGWILVGNETTLKTSKRFASRESTTPEQRPQLSIDYTPPADGMGACCDLSGACTAVLQPGTACAGAYQGPGSSCLPNACPQRPGACCLADASATCNVLEEAVCASQNGTFQGTATTCSPNSCPVVLTPFVDALPIPSVATPTDGAPGAAASYLVAMRETMQRLHRDLPPTRVWGYDDGVHGPRYPGPTFEAASGAPVSVTWLNDLRDDSGSLRTKHVLPVDMCVDGAMDDAPRTIVHLHGGHVPAAVDGYPMDAYPPGQQAVYEYPNNQGAATLWYHDHAMGITRLNVYMGLAGFYLVRDDEERALALPSGEYEIPLAIQDRSFHPDGSLDYPAMWMEHFFGDKILVNGKVWPYLQVKRGKYRFRILDGSGSRTYQLRLSKAAKFTQIGSDGGLLAAPVVLSSLTVAPGERVDAIIDFSGFAPGTEIEMTNEAPAPFPGSGADGVVGDVMKFIVGPDPGFAGALPATLRTITPLPVAEATVTRELVLAKHADACGGSVWLIDGRQFDEITERPTLGTTEVWRFVNESNEMHPLHLHLAMFQVQDRQPFTLDSGVRTPKGGPIPVRPEEAGWKDTVKVGPLETARIAVRFTDYVGRFPYHCHMLEHEDHAMMRQLETTTKCGDGALGMPDEECDDGNSASGDGCSPTCKLEGAAPAGGAPVADESGCGCRAGASRAALRPALAFLALALFVRRSRRPSRGASARRTGGARPQATAAR